MQKKNLLHILPRVYTSAWPSIMSEVVPTVDRGQDTQVLLTYSIATLQQVCLNACRLFLTLLSMCVHEKKSICFICIYKNIFKKTGSNILHIISHIRLTLTTLHCKRNRLLFDTQFLQLTVQTRTHALCLTIWVCCYFPDITHSVLLKETVSSIEI
jgi:hypothetical protein